MEKTPSSRQRPGALEGYGPLICLLLVFVAAIFIYAPTLSFPFVFDDEFNIVKNPGVLDPAHLWPPAGTRYLAYLSFALNHIAGGLDPWGYRLVNVLIHAANALFVYWLAALTFRTPAAAPGAARAPSAAAIALVASVIFFAHPVQTGAVTYITQRFASLATFFYLSSLVLFIRWRLGHPMGYLLYALSFVLALAAQKTKEISFTLPAVIVLYDMAFFGLRPRRGRAPLYLIPFVILLAVVPLTVLGVLFPEGGGWGFDAGTRGQQLVDLRTISRYDYLVTQSKVVVTYLRLLVLPVNQNLDYDYPLSGSLLEPGVLASILLIAAVIAASAYAFSRARKSGEACLLVASAGVFWFFITLSIESSVIPIKDVIFEHRMYLPSAGAFIAFASFVFFLAEKRSRVKAGGARAAVAAAVILALTALPLGVAAHLRNRVWSSELTLWLDVVRKSPLNARGHNNLGMAYKDLGLMDRATEEFLKAVRLIPVGPGPRLDVKADASNNLANTYYTRGMLAPAIEAYREVLKIDPLHVEAHYNLAMACEAYGCLEEAVEHYARFVELAPPNYMSYKEDARGRINAIIARQGRGSGNPQ